MVPRPRLRTCKLLLAAFALSGCATLNTQQALDKADIDAALAYSAVATAVTACEMANASCSIRGEPIRMEAWTLFGKEHQAYIMGRAVDVSGDLAALLTQAKHLEH